MSLSFSNRHPATVLLRFNRTAESGDIALWRRAELFLVIAGEVRRVLVADTKTCARSIDVFVEHEAARFLQADLFLVLRGLIAVTLLKW